MTDFDEELLRGRGPDPAQIDARAKDMSAKRDLFLEANAVLDDKGVVMLAVRSLRRQWFEELMVAKDWERKDDLTRRLQVLTAIPREIERFISDYKMAVSKQQGRR